MKIQSTQIITLLIVIAFSNTAMAQNNHTKNIFSIVPIPLRAEAREGVFELNENTRILYHPQADANRFLAEQLKTKLETTTRFSLSAHPLNHSRTEPNVILLNLVESSTLGPEGYTLTVTPKQIRIYAEKPAGLFYGIQTLYQLLPVEIESPVPRKMEWTVPCCLVSDKPRFAWRGMHLDVCRHFFPVSFIKKYIEIMSRYKLNIFHWHLTEDQGWRIEIRKYPKLTEVGAWRNETLVGHINYKPHQFDGKRYGGFYTGDEIREIVRYAAERFITIVPEIEMPGHSLAALAAYPELSCTGGPFEVAIQWGVFEDVFCAGKDTVFSFLEGVLSEVIELFPGPYIHIGGDECPKERWKVCPDCQKRIQEEGLNDENELQSYFIKRIETFLLQNDKRLIGWDEILEGGLAPEATVMSWRGMHGGIKAANAGHDVIMAPTTHCYFDYYQGVSEEPLAIGWFLPLKKVYSFEPVPPDIEESMKYHIIGGQANLWTEYIATTRHAEYMLMPRMCALSEAVWSAAGRKDFEDFSRRMEKQYKRLTLLDVNFRCPVTD